MGRRLNMPNDSKMMYDSGIEYRLVCNKNKATDVTSVAGTVDPSGAPEFTPVILLNLSFSM